MRRWIKVALAAVAVLGVGGYAAEPWVRDEVLVHRACGGALPRDAAQRLLPDGAHLESEESRQTPGLGSYSCTVAIEGDEVQDERLVDVAAWTRRDDQDREFMTTFPEEGFSAQAPLPDGLPGFIDSSGAVQLLLPCPDLGKDAEGRPRKLLVRTTLGGDTLTGVPGAAYEVAVALTNGASGRLGCGAKPLTAPAKGVPPEDVEEEPKTVPLSRAGNTSCDWAAEAGLPAGAGWRLAARRNDAAPTGRCDLYTSTGEQAGRERRQLSFMAWYGDWSNRLTVHHGKRRAMTATARCDGEAANYALDAADDIPGVGEKAQRRMLTAFAKDDVRRRGCSDLRFSF